MIAQKRGACLGLCAAALFALSGCWARITQIPPGDVIMDRNGHITNYATVLPNGPEPLKLPSGHTVQIISRAKMITPNGKVPPAVRISYLSNLPVNNNPALEKEAEEIKQVYQRKTDATGLTVLVIIAEEAVSHRPDGNRLTYAFCWKKDSRSVWHRVYK